MEYFAAMKTHIVPVISNSAKKILSKYRKSGMADLRQMREMGKSKASLVRAKKFLRETHSIMHQSIRIDALKEMKKHKLAELKKMRLQKQPKEKIKQKQKLIVALRLEKRAQTNALARKDKNFHKLLKTRY